MIKSLLHILEKRNDRIFDLQQIELSHQKTNGELREQLKDFKYVVIRKLNEIKNLDRRDPVIEYAIDILNEVVSEVDKIERNK